MDLILNYQDNSPLQELLLTMEKDYSINTKSIVINTEEYQQICISNGLSEPKRIINNSAAISNVIDSNRFKCIMDLNNIPFTNDDDPLKVYEVLIADLTIISIKVKAYEQSKVKNYYINEKENKKVAELARKSLFVCGLDIGLITIIYSRKRVYKIKEINPCPEMKSEETAKVEMIIKKWCRLGEEEANSGIKLGADPEFVMISNKNGRIIFASDHFPREGIVGCDNIRIPNRIQRPVAEIRPLPASSPYELLENIRKALLSAQRMAPYKNVRWVAGSQPPGGYSIGGHIHFSEIDLNNSLLRSFDNYLTIPLFLVENPLSAAKRRKKYGMLCDYRIKDHGGFEYRTLGSWLVSPEIAIATICLARLVALNHYYLQENYFASPQAQQAFYNGDQNYFREIFLELWTALEALDMYQENKSELDYLKAMITKEEQWDEKSDFRIAWQMPTDLLKGKTRINNDQVTTMRRNNENRSSSIITVGPNTNRTASNISAPRDSNRSARIGTDSINLRNHAASNSQPRQISSDQIQIRGVGYRVT